MNMIKGDDDMFDKLTFEQMANFYGAVAELEKEYGKHRVMDGIRAMAKVLDENQPLDDKRIGQAIQEAGRNKSQIEQLELLDSGKKKKYYGRRKIGANERIIRDYCKTNHPGISAEAAILKLYYVEKMKQHEIGKMIGVDQRAISKFIQDIPEKKRFKLIGDVSA